MAIQAPRHLSVQELTDDYVNKGHAHPIDGDSTAKTERMRYAQEHWGVSPNYAAIMWCARRLERMYGYITMRQMLEALPDIYTLAKKRKLVNDGLLVKKYGQRYGLAR